jgi:hypothetical protein
MQRRLRQRCECHQRNVTRARSPLARFQLRRMRTADERSAVVRVAAHQARGGVFAPSRDNVVNEPSALWEVDSQARLRRLFAHVHVFGSFDHLAAHVIERNPVLPPRHCLSVETRLGESPLERLLAVVTVTPRGSDSLGTCPRCRLSAKTRQCSTRVAFSRKREAIPA